MKRPAMTYAIVAADAFGNGATEMRLWSSIASGVAAQRAYPDNPIWIVRLAVRATRMANRAIRTGKVRARDELGLRPITVFPRGSEVMVRPQVGEANIQLRAGPPDPEIVVVLPGYAEWTKYGRQRAGGTVTLIKGPPHVLVDTGAPHQKTELTRALQNVGVRPQDISYVVLTHGQLDHVGNNNLFTKATFILDMDVSKDGEYWIQDFKEDAFHISGIRKGASVAVIPTPGHTDHDLSVIVENSEGTTAIVGDLFEYEGDWRDENAWKHWSKDWKLQKLNRERILRIADYIVPGHGPRFSVPTLAELDLAPTAHARSLTD